MKINERKLEACKACRRRKRKCHEGIKGKESCRYCAGKGNNYCSYVSENTENHLIEAMKTSSTSPSTTETTSSTNLIEDLLEDHQSLNKDITDADVLQGHQVNSSYEATTSQGCQSIVPSQTITPISQGQYLPNTLMSEYQNSQLSQISTNTLQDLQFQDSDPCISSRTQQSYQSLEYQHSQLSAQINANALQDYQVNSPYLGSQPLSVTIVNNINLGYQNPNINILQDPQSQSEVNNQYTGSQTQFQQLSSDYQSHANNSLNNSYTTSQAQFQQPSDYQNPPISINALQGYQNQRLLVQINTNVPQDYINIPQITLQIQFYRPPYQSLEHQNQQLSAELGANTLQREFAELNANILQANSTYMDSQTQFHHPFTLGQSLGQQQTTSQFPINTLQQVMGTNISEDTNVSG
ncbi:6140_t:CDS:10, partial [Cetraspora pellucida]